MNKKKVIFILYSLSVGGAERRAASLANHLANDGFEIEILLLDNSNVKFEIDHRVKIIFLCDDPSSTIENKHDMVDVYYSRKTPVPFTHQLRLKWNKAINKRKYLAYDQLQYLINRYANKIYDYIKNKPDYTVVSWMTFANISMCYALRKLHNEKIIVECTSPQYEFESDHPVNDLKKKYYPLVNKCVCQTEESVEYYSFLPHVKKYVIPNPIIGSYPTRHLGKRNKKIVTFSRLSKVKNIPLLIDAFCLLHKDYSEYQLLIFGEGEEKERLLQYASDKEINEFVSFFDFDVNIHSRIVDYAMFVSSSDREGMSNSMLEAMAIGLPTISTDCPAGAARMLIDNYVNGIVVPMRNPQAMYEAMKYIIEHPQEAEQMSIKATEIRDKLSMSRIGEQWAKALTD